MIRKICIAALFVAVGATSAAYAKHIRHAERVASIDANGNLDSMIAQHAVANNIPEAIVRRIIKRESGGRPGVVSKGNYGLMQIKLGTARAMGYQGSAAGLLDADTNMTYAVKYLAGAYHTAGGNADRTVHYYAAGYYSAAKSRHRKDSDNPLETFASAAPNSSGIPYSGPGSLNFK